MQPLFSAAEWNEARGSTHLSLQCLQCRGAFLRTKEWVQRVQNPRQRSTGDFCSTRCAREHRYPANICICRLCAKPFSRRPSQVARTQEPFCGHSCATTYRNTHKVSGTRVSKLERWLQGHLPVLYPDLEFHFNRRDAISSELDIFIPTLRLAFELNGIFHYEPIYGNEKLSSTQTNDQRKFQACIEHGIELCVIDVSGMKYFKPARAKQYLNIIEHVLAVRASGIEPERNVYKAF